MTNKQLLIRPFLAILMALFALSTWATDPREDLYLTAERLFHISRSVNRNLVCYDAHLTNNGQLITDEPINVYWVNREERPGEKNGLNFFQRKMAYGYKVVDKGDDYSVVTLSAYPDRQLTIKKHDGRYICQVKINGQESILRELYVQASPRNPVSVEYVELRGETLKNGAAVNERVQR